MSANNALHIDVLGGDGIGPEVMAPALEVLRKIEATSDLKFRFSDAPAGANNYRATGKSMPESTIRLCDEADAILLGACVGMSLWQRTGIIGDCSRQQHLAHSVFFSFRPPPALLPSN